MKERERHKGPALEEPTEALAREPAQPAPTTELPGVTVLEQRKASTCAVCRDTVLLPQAGTACPSCSTVVHVDCGRRLRACPTLGCNTSPREFASLAGLKTRCQLAKQPLHARRSVLWTVALPGVLLAVAIPLGFLLDASLGYAGAGLLCMWLLVAAWILRGGLNAAVERLNTNAQGQFYPSFGILRGRRRRMRRRRRSTRVSNAQPEVEKHPSDPKPEKGN